MKTAKMSIQQIKLNSQYLIIFNDINFIISGEGTGKVQT
jgi:hypothetical protein